MSRDLMYLINEILKIDARRFYVIRYGTRYYATRKMETAGSLLH